MTRQQALARAKEQLARHNIENASLEAEVLLCHAMKIDRAQLLSEPEAELKKRHADTFKTYIKRRLKGEPHAYITAHREFYGLDFYVDKNVLIPRPETEALVEQGIKHARFRLHPLIVDVGTGSGAIAISLAKNLPHAEIIGIDISRAALKVAESNVEKHKVGSQVKLLRGDLLEPAPPQIEIIVANLPYVLTEEVPQVNTFGFEPTLALDGGPDGLDIVRRLCQQAKDKLSPQGCLLLEIGMGQSKATELIVKEVFPTAKIEIICDLAGIERVVCAALF